MITPKLQEHKVRRNIDRYGELYTFTRPKLDKFKEPAKDKNGNPVIKTVAEIMGIFHETGVHFALIIVQAAKTQVKPTPSILAMWEDVSGLQAEDRVCIPPNSGREYKITSINDIGNLELFAHISLEVIIDGLSV